ncbi:hypothetical protein DHD08_06810 [Arenibacter sp. H213]|nr:hypothetical protein [Arenibacter sp. H213]
MLAQKKRNKEKGALNNKFFRHQGRKTVFETPRRPFSGTPDFGAFVHYFAFKEFGCAGFYMVKLNFNPENIV